MPRVGGGRLFGKTFVEHQIEYCFMSGSDLLISSELADSLVAELYHKLVCLRRGTLLCLPPVFSSSEFTVSNTAINSADKFATSEEDANEVNVGFSRESADFGARKDGCTAIEDSMRS